MELCKEDFGELMAHIDAEIEYAEHEIRMSVFGGRRDYYLTIHKTLTDIRERLIRILNGVD